MLSVAFPIPFLVLVYLIDQPILSLLSPTYLPKLTERAYTRDALRISKHGSRKEWLSIS